MQAVSMLNAIATLKHSRQRLLILLLLLVFVSACTGKTSYRFLDWLVAWSVDDYVQWDNQQQHNFDRRLERLLTWHQSEQLPLYSAFLQQLVQDTAQPLNTELVSLRLDEMLALSNQVIVKVEPDAIALLSSLDDKQVLGLQENLAKATAKLEKKYLKASDKSRSKKRIKNVEKVVKRFIGRLSKPQKQFIAEWDEQLQDSTGLWIESRKNWAQKFISIVEQRQATEFPGRLQSLLLDPQTLWSDQYRQMTEANFSVAINLVIQLQKSMSEKQRVHFVDELDQWSTTFDDLAAELLMATGGGAAVSVPAI
ncbi:MAG: hypothetical protein ACJAYG_000745 [Oceanicoccus sp.]|jgi:hypothetical protein